MPAWKFGEDRNGENKTDADKFTSGDKLGGGVNCAELLQD